MGFSNLHRDSDYGPSKFFRSVYQLPNKMRRHVNSTSPRKQPTFRHATSARKSFVASQNVGRIVMQATPAQAF